MLFALMPMIMMVAGAATAAPSAAMKMLMAVLIMATKNVNIWNDAAAAAKTVMRMEMKAMTLCVLVIMPVQ